MPMMPTEPNEARPELLSTLSIDMFKTHNSASRSQMVGNHLGQRLTLDQGEERFIQSGNEPEFAKHTFSVKMPHDGRVIAVIERYDYTHDADNIAFSPQTVMVYEREDTREVDFINLPQYSSQHQYFGFEYKKWPAWGKLRPGAAIRAGETFLESPSVNADGGYEMARNLRVAFMTVPGIAEDGIVLSESAAKKYAFKTWETRVVEWGTKQFPINLYGTAENPKPFPDIGDYVRADGALIGLRDSNEDYAPVEQSIYDMMELDPFFDDVTYVSGGGRVVDIRVHHQRGNQHAYTPELLEAQVLKYDRGRRRFYQEILDTYNTLRRKRGESLQVTQRFTALVREALQVVGHHSGHPNEPIRLLYRQTPIDEWRVEFVIEHHHFPRDGAKLTDFHGGKGVIVEIWADERMPVDANGVRAEAIMDGMATVNRMNFGRLYEHYINAASFGLAQEISRTLGVEGTARDLYKQLARLEQDQPAVVDQAWSRLMRYYEIVTPTMHAKFATGEYRQPRIQHLENIVRNQMIHLIMPTDNQPETTNIVRHLEEEYRPLYAPVTYIGASGRQVTTRNPVRIAHLYVMLLEKIADDWSAISSGKLQHHGVLAQISASDKYAKPSRNTPVRAMGESEVRIYAAYCGPKLTADLIDRNNNPFTHKHMLEAILNAEKPGALVQAVDRNKIPYGGSKPLQALKHVCLTGGWQFTYRQPTTLPQFLR